LNPGLENTITLINPSPDLEEGIHKILDGERISPGEGLALFEKADLGLLGMLAGYVCDQKNGKNVYFIRNFHIEPTNICIHKCKFCSFSHHFSPEKWEMTIDEILEEIRRQDPQVSEVHITGAVHPDRDIFYYGDLLKKIRKLRPSLHIKAYSAIELDFMFRKSNMTVRQGLLYLKDCGLESIPGGGAEIFDEKIRRNICGMKATTASWLEIHETAHKLGIPSNATILYGHVETPEHRIDHLERLRRLQDFTGGFNAFIPLKFRKQNNSMSSIPEVSVIDDMRMYAMSRIYLDNFPHIKAYWPSIGKKIAQVALSFGVDDLDGTINDSTRIYSLAGAEEQSPSMTASEMIEMIKDAGKEPVERDSYYRKVSSEVAKK
jgi:aminodeoxyfutalosine synthase